MQLTLKTRFSNWVFRPKGPEAGPVILTQRRVFILPTRYGITFAFLLLLLLTGSINYNLSLGFVLTFLLGTMGIVSILHTFRNLAGLSIRPGKTESIFAGQTASFIICLENPGTVDRHSIALLPANLTTLTGSSTAPPNYYDVLAEKITLTKITLPAPKRGLLTPGRVTLFTTFPLGLFRAWSYVELDMRCIVYPKPDSAETPPPTPQPSPGDGIEYGIGTDDFTGLRPYHVGDSPRHIAWKVLARGHGLQIKQFSGRAQAELWLDWSDPEMTAYNLGTEEKLSRLTRWVLDAHASGLSYGLRLPGKKIEPASGELHRKKCLEALALFVE